MSGEAEVKGLEQVIRNFSAYSKKVVADVTREAQICQVFVQDEARRDHAANAHAMGRFESHTTHLVQSIQPGRVVIMPGYVEAEIEARQDYASYVEFGTSRSRPYPFMAPAIIKNGPVFFQRIRAAIPK